MDLARAVWTDHARRQAESRGIPEAEVEDVLRAPELVRPTRTGRVVAQSTVSVRQKRYLLRVFVDVDREPFEIVTAYRTSKIERYGAEP